MSSTGSGSEPRPSPREFLRARRPEHFSDTVAEEEPAIDRQVLEYHLDSLTSRNQSTEFERFVRGLVKREVCPNIIPQTGPTGGGDSKVDSETYPVAEDLELVWYIGIPSDAAAERWAFAISAMERWRQKVKSDVAKVAGTERGYTKAFFISNQFIKDRKRAEVEDGLSEKHGLDVRIFDRTWILDRMFEGNHLDLAVEELRLETSKSLEIQRGPRDTRRAQELEEIEGRLQEAAQSGEFTRAIVDDAIRAAELSRGLEEPKSKVEGRLVRATRIAEKYGSNHQQLLAAYNRAWTAYWWYEDYSQFAEHYRPVEQLAQASRNAYHLELLCNLWFLLVGAVEGGQLSQEDVGLSACTSTLSTALERLEGEEERPSTALHAESLKLLMQLLQSDPDDMDPVLRRLEDVVERSERLIGFSFVTLVDLLSELGDAIGDIPAYDSLFETIAEVTARREGEVSSARLLMRRGAQHLDKDRPYPAISTLGRALRYLHKHETRHELVRTLYLCGRAYERVGLMWAARGTQLSAASVETNELWKYEEVTPLQAGCFEAMRWLELQLGRIPHALAWNEIFQAVMSALADQPGSLETDDERELIFDAALACLLLKADLQQLRRLESLSDPLDSLGLFLSSAALLYALGWEDEMPDEALKAWREPDDAESLTEFFKQWRDQPVADQLPSSPELGVGRTVTLRSSVLGCNISVKCDNRSPAIELGESFLAAIESLLSTGMLGGITPFEPILTGRVQVSEYTEKPFRFSLEESDGRPHLEIYCQTFSPHGLEPEDQTEIKERLFDLLVRVLARVFVMSDYEEVLTRLFEDERAVERAIDFTTSFGPVGNVLGDEPRTRLQDWVPDDVREYKCRRDQPWDSDVEVREARENGIDGEQELRPGEGEVPDELQDPGRTRHDEVEVVSLIRNSLWDQAGWTGSAFVVPPESPPCLVPVYTDRSAAKEIFKHWRSELGQVDSQGLLRVSIVRRIRQDNPNAYTVVFGSEPKSGSRHAERLVLFSRLCQMEPNSSENLDRFLTSYREHQKYWLLPGGVTESGPEFLPDLRILKREIHVREAWEIGRHDPDMVAIDKDATPIIPSEVDDPPVKKLLEWRRSRSE